MNPKMPRNRRLIPTENSAASMAERAMGEYYRAFVVTEERVTKWPAPRDDVEYDVLRVSVNVRTN